jgi:hypothetical protein
MSQIHFHPGEMSSKLADGVRRAFTRQRLIANLKTFLVAAPLTILIWIYAEQQQLVTGKDLPLRISIVSADPAHRVVELVSPPDGELHVTVEGSQSGIDQVRDLMQQTLIDKALQLEIGGAAVNGPTRLTLVTMDQIASNRLFFSHGVTVTGCVPETLVVQQDKLLEEEVPVKAPPDVPGLTKAVFDPPTVKMVGPSQMLEELLRRGGLSAVADLASEPSLKEPGEHDHIPVHLIPVENVTIAPDSVMANLWAQQADQSRLVSPVAVFIEAPKWLTDNFKIDYKDVLDQPVTVTGPPGQISLVDPARPRVIAVLQLANADAGFHGLKAVTFQDVGLPDGVHVKPENPPRMIQVDVTPR